MNRSMLAFILALVWSLGLNQPALAHPEQPAPAPPQPTATMQAWSVDEANRLESYYKLFTDTCQLAPTRLQDETLAAAERIFDLLHGYHPQPQTRADVERVLALTETHYGRLLEEYPALRITWDGVGLKFTAPRAPLALARGIARPVLAEVHNATSASLTLTPLLEGSAQPCAPALVIPPGQSCAQIIPLLASAQATTLKLALAPQGAPLAPRQVALPVKVAEPVTLRGTLLATETGKVWPGRVRVECSDGILRHGKAYAGNTTLSEKQIVFRPAFYALPFFYSDGHFEIDVPPGPTRVTLERGFEHPLLTRQLDLQPGERREITLRSGRAIDMQKLGWISGDTHIHWVKNSWDINEDIALLAMVQRAEDLRVANNLTLYQWRPDGQGGPFTKPDQFPMGPVREYSDGDYHLQMAEEYRNDNHWGHINLLDIKQLIMPIAAGPGSGGPLEAFDYPLNSTIIREAHRQGGISCEAHGLGPFFCSDVPVNVISGLSDSLDQMPPKSYYHFLNCGLHIGLSNGSDHPARVAGCTRAYVKVEGPFTYKKWIDGVRKGRTFTTSGPLLFLTVNGAEIGQTLDVKPGQRLKVRARAWSRHPLGNFAVVSNGQVIRSLHTQKNEAELAFELNADESRWFTAHCAPDETYDALAGPGIAHTSAIYTRIGGREVIKPESVKVWIANIRAHLERVEKTARFANEAQRQEALAYIRGGLAKYEALLKHD